MNEQPIEPCPFCGGEPQLVDSRCGEFWWVACKGCGYQGRICTDEVAAISAHNRVSLAVQLVNEFYENDTERDVFFNRIQAELAEKKVRNE